MEINNHTLIKELLANGIISVRAANVCAANGIVSVGDLLEVDDRTLFSFRNCGKKSLSELHAIKHKFDTAGIFTTDEPDLFSGLYTAMLLEIMLEHAGDNKQHLIDAILTSYSSAEQFIADVLKHPEKAVENLRIASPMTKFEIIILLIESLRTAVEREDKDNHFCDALLACLLILERWSNKRRNGYRYLALDSASKCYLDLKFAEQFARLSTRTRNIFSYIDSIEGMLPYLYCGKTIDINRMKLCGRKSANEFENFIKNIRRLVDGFLSELDNMSEGDRSNLIFCHRRKVILSKYPFLKESEASTLMNSDDAGTGRGAGFMLSRYIMRVDKSQHYAYCKYYGFNDAKQCTTLENIGAELELSRERVRQLLSKSIRFPQTLSPFIAYLQSYLTDAVISYDNPIWNEILEQEIIPSVLDKYQIMALMTAIDDSYTITSVAPGKEYLIKKADFKGVRLLSIIRDIEHFIDNRRVTEETFSIVPYIQAGTTKEGEGWSPSVNTLIRYYLSSLDNCVACDGDNVTIRASVFNIRQAIEDIIARKGEPITFRELYDTFSTLYPDHKPRNEASFKSYIFHNKAIRSIGKSGRYILSSWENFHTGTITDLLADTLEASELPMHLDTLFETVKPAFPNTKKTSCSNLMFLDTQRRFVQFADNYYGLSSRQYPSNWERHVPREINYSFESRLASLAEFAERNSRMPYSGGDNDEKQLFRWVKCVKSGRIQANTEQRDAFDKVMTDNALLPQDGSEIRFKRNCELTLAFAVKNKHLPTAQHNMSLYVWLRKELHNRDKHSGNTARYFKELLAELEALGLLSPSIKGI